VHALAIYSPVVIMDGVIPPAFNIKKFFVPYAESILYGAQKIKTLFFPYNKKLTDLYNPEAMCLLRGSK